MDVLDRLKAMNAGIRRRDSLLHQELAEEEALESPGREAMSDEIDLESMPDEIDLESIVLRRGRPVLGIKRNAAELVLEEADSVTWRARLSDASERITRAARSVGRIEVEGHGLSWLGTGWLVADDTIVTNRHVAAEFGRDTGTHVRLPEGTERRRHARLDRPPRGDRPRGQPGLRAHRHPAHRGLRRARPRVLAGRADRR